MEDTFYNYEEALRNPLDVKTLSFSFNNSYHPYTTSLPDERIKTLINLEKIVIGNYKEIKMPLPNEILDLKKICEIDIDGENLDELPPVIWEIKSLTHLTIEINDLKDGDLKLSNLEKLQSFGIKLNNTEVLSKDIFDNTNITELYLTSDNLKVIPNLFNRLIHLKNLSLLCENVEILPSTISSLSNLYQLNIYNKVAKKLDVDFTLLEKLEHFRWGQAGFFPINITSAKNLKIVTFDVSYFDRIDANELAFQNLEMLDFSFCAFKTIPHCFETLGVLKHLILSHSNFTEIDFNFEKLTNLVVLSFRKTENFEQIDIRKFIHSINTIKNLKFLETPILSNEQNQIRKDFKFNFEWIEE